MSDTDPLNDLFEALAHPRRRQVLVALLEHPSGDMDPLKACAGSGEETRGIEIELHHTHLPKLAAMGFITWHRETGRVSRGPRWDGIEPVLTLLETHREELTAGWPTHDPTKQRPFR